MNEKYPCPYCNKEYDKTWKVTNHVRISAGDHGPKHSLPKDYKEPEAKVSTGGPANLANPEDQTHPYFG